MTSLEPSMHEIRVSTVSPEEASYGVAEFWAGGKLIAYTHATTRPDAADRAPP